MHPLAPCLCGLHRCYDTQAPAHLSSKLNALLPLSVPLLVLPRTAHTLSFLCNGERSEQTIDGRIDRHANQNGTARIHGGLRLRAWFQAHVQVMESVAVDLNSPDLIQLTHGDPSGR